MKIKLKQTKDLWRKVGEEEVLVGEYNEGHIILPEFAFLWNKRVDRKRVSIIIKSLMEIDSHPEEAGRDDTLVRKTKSLIPTSSELKTKKKKAGEELVK